MDLVFISNQVKYDILKISGKSAAQAYNLQTDTPLCTIGYEDNDELCRKLEDKLQQVADEYRTGKQICNGAVSKNLTVRQCIQMVLV